MEFSAFALGVVNSEDLATKLAPPPRRLSDRAPDLGPPPMAPRRPAALAIRPGREVKRLPRLTGMVDPRQRGRILHALANHELQAAELYAWAILAYPAADPAFRQDLLTILQEEQRHTRMYLSRLSSCGLAFGDQPLTGYFWGKAPDLLASPLCFVCAMALTFENANLDHTVALEEAALGAGDEATAAVIRRVREDEVGHVAFGWRWLSRMKDPGQSMWEAYLANVAWPLRPALARGQRFNRADRLAAGLEPAFIDLLEAAEETGSRSLSGDEGSSGSSETRGSSRSNGSSESH